MGTSGLLEVAMDLDCKPFELGQIQDSKMGVESWKASDVSVVICPSIDNQDPGLLVQVQCMAAPGQWRHPYSLDSHPSVSLTIDLKDLQFIGALAGLLLTSKAK